MIFIYFFFSIIFGSFLEYTMKEYQGILRKERLRIREFIPFQKIQEFLFYF